MRILVLQFVASVRGRPVPRFEPQLGTLLALLRSRGHELALLGLDRYDAALIKGAVAQHLPQLVYADISLVCADIARRCLEHLAGQEFLPVVAGGLYPAVDPAGALSLPGVQAVALGEPDATFVTYLERIKDPAAGQVVHGVWLRDERGLARPQMPPLIEELDSLPLPERDLFGYAEHVRRTGVVEVAIGRGCPQRCAYCPNATIAELYGQLGPAGPTEQFVRRRSAANILDELDQLRARYEPVRAVRFLDHTFAQDEGWLAEFLDPYVYRCALPFYCHLRLNRVTARVARLLDDAGCAGVDVELISGSDFLRNEVFAMGLSSAEIEAAFARLQQTRLRVRAIVYLGAPYESPVSLEHTRDLLRRLRPHSVDVRAYYPFPGTAAAQLCQESGWLHARGEEQYHGDQPGIDLPACRPGPTMAFVRRLRSEWAAGSDQPWWRRWSRAPLHALERLFRRAPR